jgi:hypothetical protein
MKIMHGSTVSSSLAFNSTASSTPSTTGRPAKTAEHLLQDVFATVLAQSGKQGYVSAEPVTELVTEASSLDERITTSWENWFSETGQSRYSFQAGPANPSVRAGKNVEDLKHDYGRILSDAYNNGGYATPSTYLKSLTQEDLKAIQQVHHLADSIQVTELSDEAALNLLLPPAAQVDENHDGLTAVGAAYTIRFPNSNTPKTVRDAWEAATANLTESERMTYELEMCLPLLTANLHCDANGTFVHASNPGDADWVNPMAATDYSYADAADGWLQYLDAFQSQMSVERYEQDVHFWTSFRDLLQS